MVNGEGGEHLWTGTFSCNPGDGDGGDHCDDDVGDDGGDRCDDDVDGDGGDGEYYSLSSRLAI